MRVPFNRVMIKKTTAEATEHVDIAGVSASYIVIGERELANQQLQRCPFYIIAKPIYTSSNCTCAERHVLLLYETQ